MTLNGVVYINVNYLIKTNNNCQQDIDLYRMMTDYYSTTYLNTAINLTLFFFYYKQKSIEQGIFLEGEFILYRHSNTTLYLLPKKVSGDTIFTLPTSRYYRRLINIEIELHQSLVLYYKTRSSSLSHIN